MERRPADDAAQVGGRQEERLIRWVFLLGRLAPLSQWALVIAGHVAGPWPGFFAVLVAESVLLLPFAATGWPNAVFLGADVIVCAGVLAASAVVARHPAALAQLWGGLLYVVSVSAVLLRTRQQAVVLAGLWVTGESVAMAIRFGLAAVMTWRQLAEAGALVAMMLLLYWLAAEYRRSTAALDRAREAQVAQAGVLATERERGRQNRLLHDRVLQTLDVLARGRGITDSELLEHVRAEALWLRQLVSGELDGPPRGLRAGLAETVRAHTGGLAVELHAGRRHPPVSPAAAEALSAAVGEALTNVRKHAGVERAVVSVLPARNGVLVSVVDAGRGFDPAARGPGIGIRESLYERMRQVGGTARVSSAPGQGTEVELWVPAGAILQMVNGEVSG